MINLEYKIFSSSCWLGHTYTHKGIQLLLLTHTCNYKLKIKRFVQKVFRWFVKTILNILKVSLIDSPVFVYVAYKTGRILRKSDKNIYIF